MEVVSWDIENIGPGKTKFGGYCLHWHPEDFDKPNLFDDLKLGNEKFHGTDYEQIER